MPGIHEVLHRPRLEMGMAFLVAGRLGAGEDGSLDPALWTRHVEYVEREDQGKRTFDFCRMGTWDRIAMEVSSPATLFPIGNLGLADPFQRAEQQHAGGLCSF